MFVGKNEVVDYYDSMRGDPSNNENVRALAQFVR